MLRARDEVRPLIETPSFVFLHVATPHKRKGTELLIQAFAEEFRGDDGVLLLVKSTYSARRAKARPFEIANLDEAIRNQCGSSTRVLHLVDVFSPEEMLSLYATASCVVQPSFSEGFGLVILEAMALGLPVVVTGWGGQMDFCTAQNTFLLDYDLVPAGECQYDCDSMDALMAMPQLGHLRERLRFVYDHRDDAERVGESAARDVADMTWDTSARQLLDVISDMRTAEIDERNEAQRCVN
jgi:glycosyltransferase involved in cell wall biosynthesis